MMPPTSIDGTDITGATIDGTDVTEITVDGDTVFTAAPQVPTNGLLHQWDFNDAGTTTTFLPDLVGGEDMTGSIAGLDTINGLQSGDFDGSSSEFQTSPNIFSTALNNHAIYTVFEFDTLSSDATVVGSVNPGNTPNFAAQGDFKINIGSNLRDGPEDTNPHIGRIRFQPDNISTLEVSGSPSVSGNVGSRYPFDLALGYYGASNIRYMDGSIGECLIYDHTASGYSATDVKNYLSSKWSISI